MTYHKSRAPNNHFPNSRAQWDQSITSYNHVGGSHCYFKYERKKKKREMRVKNERATCGYVTGKMLREKTK